MKKDVLKALTEHPGEWLSGEELSNVSGVSRTAVWKQIRQLKQEGYAIESMPSKGYRMNGQGEVLSSEGLQLCFEQSRLIRDVIYMKTIDSTNKYAKNVEGDGILVIAEEQTGGRGRLGRQWESPAGQGLWFSLILKPDIDPSEASLVTQIAAGAVWTGIMEITGLRAEVKWPNDILIGGRKVCGILTEMNSELGAVQRLVVGIGINVNLKMLPDEIAQVGTSLQLETGREWSRVALLHAIIRAFESDYFTYLDTREIKAVIKICRDNSYLLGKRIRIIQGGREEFATAVDISDRGELMVQKPSGAVVPLISGEISVRADVSD